jgi:hypothetical protein
MQVLAVYIIPQSYIAVLSFDNVYDSDQLAASSK